jgi:amidase
MPELFKDYRTISAEKKLQRKKKIPGEWLLPSGKYYGANNLTDVPVACEILSDVECHITSEYDATALLEKLKEGVWSAEQVTVAFCKRAAIAQQLVCRLQSVSCSIVPQLTIAVDELLDRDLLRQGNPASLRT